MSRIAALSLLAVTMFFSGLTHANLNIEITRSLGTAFPIAIVPFAGDRLLPAAQQIAPVIAGDLVNSGRFAAIPENQFLSHPHHAADVIFKDWRLVKADALVIGTVTPSGNGTYEVTFRLYDVFNKTQLAAFRYQASARTLREVGHEISDAIYQKILGIRGAFNTRIAYVARQHLYGDHFVYRLEVADYDGWNPHTILKSSAPIISPAWSPDGRQIAYVSFERRRSTVYVENVRTGARRLVAAYAGVNGAPAFAPDGVHLALMLAKNGNPDLYVMNLVSGGLRQITFGPSINTEPTWSPDGRQLAFTSDRSGNPQIYLMNADGSEPQRLSFQGRYNAAASFAPDGKNLAIVSRIGGAYHIALLNIKDASLTPLTDTKFDESPSFSPNGQTILYDTLVGGRRVLATVSVDGNVRQVIRLAGEDVSNPAWSPFNQSTNQTEGVTQ